jgi:hypothetical protein
VLTKITHVVFTVLSQLSISGIQGLAGASATHAAKEVSDEHNNASALCVVELIECGSVAILVKDFQFASLSKGGLIGFGMAASLLLCHGCSDGGYKNSIE